MVTASTHGGGVNPERHDNAVQRQHRLGEDGRPASMGDGGDRRPWAMAATDVHGASNGRGFPVSVFLAESEPSEEHGEGVEARCGGEGTVRRG
jgi:hypothetical protein